MSNAEENKARISSADPEIVKAYLAICGIQGVVTLETAIAIAECDSVEKLQEFYPDHMTLTRALALAVANVMAYTEDLYSALEKAGVKVNIGQQSEPTQPH